MHTKREAPLQVVEGDRTGSWSSSAESPISFQSRVPLAPLSPVICLAPHVLFIRSTQSTRGERLNNRMRRKTLDVRRETERKTLDATHSRIIRESFTHSPIQRFNNWQFAIHSIILIIRLFNYFSFANCLVSAPARRVASGTLCLSSNVSRPVSRLPSHVQSRVFRLTSNV